jgi:protein-disulfide isomerase
MRRILPFLSLVVAALVAAAPVRADSISIVKLMATGPLPEMALGQPTAPVTIVEYVSLTCSHCAHFHDATFDVLKTKYVDTGKVYYVLREFPLDPVALGAIMAARCAPEDQFFPIVQTLFRNQSRWAFVEKPAPALIAELKPFGFTQESFGACLDKADLAQQIVDTAQRAEDEFDVHGTPTFFINGERHVGDMQPAELEALLDPLVAKTQK